MITGFWSFAKTKLALESLIEPFSFERRKVIGFALSTVHDWLKKIRATFSSNQK